MDLFDRFIEKRAARIVVPERINEIAQKTKDLIKDEAINIYLHSPDIAGVIRGKIELGYSAAQHAPGIIDMLQGSRTVNAGKRIVQRGVQALITEIKNPKTIDEIKEPLFKIRITER